MFGIRFIKIQPTTHLLQFRGGKIARSGPGLAFFYYAPTTSLVAVPMASTDAPFIFDEVTADFQEVTIQGQVTYRVVDPHKISQLLNFTLDPTGRTYVSDDPQKLSQRVINATKVLTRAELQNLPLRDALRSSDVLVAKVLKGLRGFEEILALGLEVLGLSVLAIRPTPETARALEAEAREKLLRESDEAIYTRRNAAVEQERAIKENELNTEIAVENKKRQIREAQMDAERAVQEKQHQLKEADMLAKISLEEKNKELVSSFAWDADYLIFTVREPFPSKTSAASLAFGKVTKAEPLVLISQMAENGVIFSDGIESDFLEFNSGTQATIATADRQGHLVV